MAGSWGTSELLAACCGPAVKLWNPVASDRQAQQQETKLNEGTTVHALDWSSNNKVLAVAGEKAQVSMYGNSQLIGQIPNLPTPSIDGITSVRFGSDSKRMVIGCKNRSLHVLDLRQQGSGAKSNLDHRAAVCSVSISPDDAVIASSSTGGQLLLHDFKTGSKLMALSSDTSPKTSLTFCPADAQLLAAAAEDGSVCIWNVRTRLPVHELQQQHKGPASGVAFAPDSTSVLYTCGQDGKLSLVDMRRQHEMPVVLQQPLASLSARFDGRLLAAGTMGGVVLLFDVRKLGAALSSYAFSEQAPVAEVRWQHAPKSRDKGKAGSTAAAATAAPAPAAVPAPSAGTAAPVIAAGGARQQSLGGTALASAALPSGSSSGPELGRSSSGGAGAGPATGTGRQQGDAVGGSGRSSVRSGLSQEGSQGSDFGLDMEELRAVSPVHHRGYSPPADTASAATASVNTAATPSNATSLASGMSGMAPYMVTPGFGVTRGLLGDGVDATPTSRAGPGSLRAGGHEPQQPAPGTRAALTNGVQRLNKGDPAAPSQAPKPPNGAPSIAPRPPVAPAANAGTVGGGRPPSRSETAPAAAATAARNRAALSAAATAAAAAPAAGGGAREAAGQEAPAAGGRMQQQQQQDQQQEQGQQAAAGKLSSRHAAAGPVIGGQGVKEEMFKAYVDESIGAVRQDIRDLHLEMLRQFHQAQMDLMSLVEGVVARQDELAQQVEQLNRHMERLGGRQDLLAWL